MDHFELFKNHLKQREQQAQDLLSVLKYDSIIFDSGVESYYAEDDQTYPYRPAPAFKSWCPEVSSGSAIHVKLNSSAHLLRVIPQDFWHASPEDGEWVKAFEESKVFSDRKSLVDSLPKTGRHLWIGPGLEMKDVSQWTLNLEAAVAHLHWDRGCKTAYEIECLRDANRIAALGHVAAREKFLEGGSERQIHHAYLVATSGLESELPYNNIVCLDQHAATLHYQYKSSERVEAGVLLIDGGHSVQGYGSDITRTWVHYRAPETFQLIRNDLEVLQKKLANQAVVGMNFADLHLMSIDGIGQILLDHNVLKNTAQGEQEFRSLVRSFYPHGLGHMLGVLVHDVAGRQKNRAGAACDPHPEDEKLRTNRELRNKEVITVEPGIYWIPMLWKNLDSRYLNLPLMEELTLWGGMRIEDNVVVGQKPENLTREFLA
ncbi:MAG: Xaa-Pro dipeptidase [Oligoflexales bacterium]